MEVRFISAFLIYKKINTKKDRIAMNESPQMNPLEILLIEDDLGDVELTRESLQENKISINLNVVNDGEQAMQYLSQREPYTNSICPDLIILDLNLPKKDGREVLQDIKNNNDLKCIPIVILTTSASDEDILQTYELGANCYVTKPLGLEQFEKIVHQIKDFWLTIVKLPSGSGS
jgi:CheY-like chemotaxis protein